MSDATQINPDQQDTLLLAQVFQRIEENPNRSIPFSEYMEMALYDPNLGYYSSPEARPIGRRGDFYTSVAVGETFGFLLGLQLQAEWEANFDQSSSFVAVEQGAHDGQLALDLFEGLRTSRSPLLEILNYRIVESRSSVRNWLKGRFREAGLSDKISIVDSLEGASSEQGVFLSNELQDAFPVRRIRRENGEWWELQVGIKNGELAWVTRELPENLEVFVASVGNGVEDGYTTEVCPATQEWMFAASGLFNKGLWWIIDYGYGSDDYYAPHRKDGTLRCFRNHCATENPFEFPGEIDITAHVNFTHLREAAEASGLKERRFTDQHHFLIEAAQPWLLSMEGQPPRREMKSRMRQFQTLTHPAMMGQQLKVAEFSRGI